MNNNIYLSFSRTQKYLFLILKSYFHYFQISENNQQSQSDAESSSSQDIKVQSVEDMLNDRTDYVQTLSTVCGCIVQMQDWVRDDEVTSCAICDAKFTLINRKHHCRRCGRIICKDCLGKGMEEKMCLICSKLIELQNQEFDEQQLVDLLQNTKLLQVINKKDYLLYGELIRLFQNLIVNNSARNILKNKWPQLFIKVFGLCRESLKILNQQGKNSFFQLDNQQSFDSQKAQITLQCCLGLIQNYTGTNDKQYAEDLIQYDPMGLVIDLLNSQLDLSKQEICIQIARNLCISKDLTQVLLNYEDFSQLIERLFETKVDSIRLAVIQLLTVMQQHSKDKLLQKFSKSNTDALKIFVQYYQDIRKTTKTSQTAAKAGMFAYLLLSIYSDKDELRQILIDENIYTDLAQTLQLQVGIGQVFAAYCILEALKNNQDDDDFCITLLTMVMTKTALCNLLDACEYPTIKELLYYVTKYYRDDIKSLKSKTVYQKAKEVFEDSEDQQERKILKYIQKLRD